jgi:hypothetical protein
MLLSHGVGSFANVPIIIVPSSCTGQSATRQFFPSAWQFVLLCSKVPSIQRFSIPHGSEHKNALDTHLENDILGSGRLSFAI